jgi:hypothetical protein
MGNDNHVVVGRKLCGFQGRVDGRVVMMKEPVVVAPMFRSFSSHIFPQVSQNVTVKVRVDCSVRRDQFTVNNPLRVEKNNVNSEHAASFLLLVIVGSPTAIVALFLDHNRKSLAFSHSSRYMFMHHSF